MSTYGGPHRQLIEDLANHLFTERLVFAEPGLGSKMFQGSIPCPDLLTLNKSYTKPEPTIYEIKVSVSDFKADVRAGKYLKYYPFCSRFFFAAPKGLIEKKDLPDGAGLIQKGENGWRVLVSPKVRREENVWTQMEVMSVLMSGAWTQQRVRNLQDRINAKGNADYRKVAKQIGFEIARKVRQGEQAVTGTAGVHIIETVADILDMDIDSVLSLDKYDLKNMLVLRDDKLEWLRLLRIVASGLTSDYYGGADNLAQAKQLEQDLLKQAA